MKARVLVCSLLLIVCFAHRQAAQDRETLRRAARYEPIMAEAGARHGVDPRLLWTIAFLESRFRPRQISRAGARGLMQFMPGTAARFGLKDPHDAQASIDAAARYLRKLQEIFNGRLDLILAAYNAGEGAVIAFRDGKRLILSQGRVINSKGIKTGGVPPYRETRRYVNEGARLYLGLLEGGKSLSPQKAARHRRLVLGEEKRLKESLDATQKEIGGLKQGSIYTIESAAPDPRIDNTNRSPAPGLSIYIQ